LYIRQDKREYDNIKNKNKMGCILDKIKEKREKKRHQKHIEALIITSLVP
jgi:hypothetical protein